MRFLPDSGSDGAAAVTVEELKTTGQMSMTRDRCSRDSICKVEPDLDTIDTEAALDRLLENGVVRDIPRAEGAGMKHLTTRWEKTWRKTQQRMGVKGSLRGTRIQVA